MRISRTIVEQVTQSVWQAISSEPLLTAHERVTADTGEGYFAGVVTITGDWEGAVTVECSPPLAVRTATKILQSDVATREDVCDALGEIANMIGGNIKAMLSGTCHLSLPSVVSGDDFRTRFPGTEKLYTLRFQCAGDAIIVSVLKRMTHMVS